ncbi:MAG: LPS export ABC transporter periplasmic protein LptC [Elusimicrobia bacterium]|nr:LPS export ABC transporter periplasmic protein LptC [Elusimicrobiota bacterium]
MTCNLCLVTCFLLLLVSCSGSSQSSRNKESQEPVNLIKDLELFKSKDNKDQWSLVSAGANLNEKDGKIRLAHPKLKLYAAGAITSEMSSDSGFLNLSTKDAELSGNVSIVSRTENMRLGTKTILFKSAENKIWTDEEITIYKGETVTKGRGFMANPDLTQIEIQNQETKISATK